jgi:hypothetical protein
VDSVVYNFYKNSDPPESPRRLARSVSEIMFDYFRADLVLPENAAALAGILRKISPRTLAELTPVRLLEIVIWLQDEVAGQDKLNPV